MKVNLPNSLVSYRTRQRLNSFLLYLLFVIIGLIVMFPVLINIFTAFKTGPELMKNSPLALPDSWQFTNIKTAFNMGNMLVGFKNTAILVVVSVLLNTVLGSMTAYTLNRFQFGAKKIIMAMFTVAMVIPFYTTEVSRFQIIKSLGLYDSMSAPLLIYAGTDLLQIFIYLQFIEKISNQLDESAMIDGASYFKIFFRIIFPLLIPASATLAIIKAVDIMNDMYIPYLYMPSKELHTLSTALMTFVGQRASDYGLLSAAILIVLLPTIIIYLLLQKFIFSGITEGAIKG
ncbi:multiple sugar transport system permease protein [Paenibacillus anaericanus]|uniref:Carbohydrate ABC transporter permease n=1 Tax=Paenibacillus anaericanus TaxID=170367 RepID=A0A3S1DT12_9BACL|nr:carbohydrate ABC transporter permease [Paenibacillus anaericanus]MDQ0087332.1 multiple sugar transport system permease protein [Paenibacillus anaericanus]RUT46654.1 carbohydrate ABC transporter permease [Paenibacillus anaericanus]